MENNEQEQEDEEFYKENVLKICFSGLKVTNRTKNNGFFLQKEIKKKKMATPGKTVNSHDFTYPIFSTLLLFSFQIVHVPCFPFFYNSKPQTI